MRSSFFFKFEDIHYNQLMKYVRYFRFEAIQVADLLVKVRSTLSQNCSIHLCRLKSNFILILPPFFAPMTAYETPISSASPITLLCTSSIFCAPPRVCFTLVHPQTKKSYSYTLVLFPTDQIVMMTRTK